MTKTLDALAPVVSYLPTPLYSTSWGHAYLGDAQALLSTLPAGSVDLVITSPPFALLRKKAYGNEDEATYTEWFLPFTEQVQRILKQTGSFVLELGNAWLKGRPVLSLYHYETVLRLCRHQNWYLAQEFAWYNPAKLPSPAEWVCRRRIRVKDSVSHLWWLAKTETPKAHWGDANSTSPLSMPSIWEESQEGTPQQDYEQNQVTNLLRLAHTESNTQYLRTCRALSLQSHPARFPATLPQFFILGLTDPGDIVLDIFAGSNTTGYIAEQQERHWLAFEQYQPYLAASSFRFLSPTQLFLAGSLYEQLCNSEQRGLHLDTTLTDLSEQFML